MAGLIESVKADVVIGTESWLHRDISDCEVFPSDFVAYRKDRPSHGGGVFLLVRSSLKSAALDIQCDIESVWCTITLDDNSSFAVGAFYRPPNSDYKTLQSLNEIISEVSNRTFLLAGDFNLPDLEWHDGICVRGTGCRANIEMKNIIDNYGLTQFVTCPTRNNNLLDLVFSNSPSLVNNVNVIPGISDHMAVVAEIKKECKNTSNSAARKVFLFSRGDYTRIVEKLEDYLPVFECLAEHYSMNDLWLSFKDKLLALVDKYIPAKQAGKLRKRKKPWMTSGILRLIRKRRRVFGKLKKSGSSDHVKELQALTEQYKSCVESAKTKYFEGLSNKMKTNSKCFWHYIKECGSDHVGVAELNFNNMVVVDEEAKATCLNKYFQSVFLPKLDVPSKPHPTTIPPMPPVELSVRGICSLLENQDESKAVGPDGISPRILKRCALPISLYLYIIYSKSLSTGTLPEDWKISHVVPVHKGGSKKDVTNYRPISLTSVACKIFEHILSKHILTHLTANNVLINEQHGFRKGFSCTTQLVEFFHELASNVDEGGQTDCVFLDFRKAFDTVSHSLLLAKLQTLNFDPNVFIWITNYLLNRRQCVLLNGKCSSYVNVTSGVPQGSVLGPLLFLIFVNDISVGISSRMRLFADDCVLYRQVQNEGDCAYLQNDLDCIVQWCQKWQMTLNPKKCVHMRVSKKKKPIVTAYTIDTHIVITEPTCKYLGVVLSHDCSWNANVDHVAGKAARALNFIQRNLRLAPRTLKNTAYLTCIRPILEYACPVWDPMQANLIDKLEKIQNRAARFVLGRYERRDSCSAMKAELGWELLSLRRKKLRLKFFFSVFHGRTGIDRHNYFSEPSYISSRHDHRRKVKEYRARTTMFYNSFFVMTIRDWNRLQDKQVCCINEELFYSSL